MKIRVFNELIDGAPRIIPNTAKIALVALLLVSSSRASMAYTIMGTGAESCGAWLQHRRDAPYADLQWALGYISGANLWKNSSLDTLAGTDGDGVWYWIDNYCQTHAASPLREALDAFVTRN